MIKNSILLIVVSCIFIGCGVFNQMGNNFALGFQMIIPDTCEIDLIGHISDYRQLNNKLPEEIEISEIKDSLSIECQEIIDLIGLTGYNTDSIDITYRKKLIDSLNSDIFITKSYRLKFDSDTVINVEILDGYKRKNRK